MGTMRSRLPLPFTLTISLSKSRLARLQETTSDTRIPVGYNNSRIALSRAAEYSPFLGDSSKAKTSSTDKYTGKCCSCFGVEIDPMGVWLIIFSCSRNLKNVLKAESFLATEELLFLMFRL